MDKVVKLDVRLQIEAEDFEEELGKALSGETDNFSATEESDGSDYSDDSDIDEEVVRLKELKSNLVTVDSILDMLFEYYTPSFSASASRKESVETFDILIRQFTSSIMPTYRSKYSNVLLFKFAQTNPSNTDVFMSRCIEIACEGSNSPIMRQSAAAFLASFIARAKSLPKDEVIASVSLLTEWLHYFYEERVPSCRGPDVRLYGGFYAVFQGLLYVFCFRWRDLIISDGNDDDDELGLNIHGDRKWGARVKETIELLVASIFNPLKVCSPLVVDQFDRISSHLNFVYVHSRVESNKRLQLSSFQGSSGVYDSLNNMPDRDSALTARKDEDWLELEAYFPFDPYNLPRSKHWVEGEYVEWRGIQGLDDQEYEDDSDVDGGDLSDVEQAEDDESDGDSD